MTLHEVVADLCRRFAPLPLSADTRPRYRYVLPDGRVIRVIHDKDDRPKSSISFELRPDDSLWASADRIPGTARRTVVAELVGGQ